MKKTQALTILIGSLFILTAAVSAGAATKLTVTVPFEFYAGDNRLPAGDYVFEFRGISPAVASSSSVLVQKQDGTSVTWIIAEPGQNVRHGANTQLVFNRYGDKYFLTKIECLDYQAGVGMSKAEKETRAQNQRDGGTVLVAGK